MDADDVSHPSRLEKQWQFLELHPEVDVLSCRAGFDGDKLTSKGYFLYVEAFNELLTHEQMFARRFWDAPLAHPSVMYRKDAIIQAGGYNEQPLPEDYELWLRLFEKGCRFAKLPEVLLSWTDHPNRISRTHPNYHKKAFWKLKSEYFSRWIRRAYPERLPQLYLWGETKKKGRSRYLLDAGLVIEGRIGMEGEEGAGLISYTSIPSLQEDSIILVYVSNRAGKSQISQYLESHGYKEGVNYFLMV